MELYDLLRKVVGVFDELEVRYFVTGSVAAVIYGEPRFTHDIDIVADLKPEHVRPLCQRFPAPEFYISEDAVRDAVATGFTFNIVQTTSGLKVDVMIPKSGDPLDRMRLGRARRVSAEPGLEAVFSSPEDLIIKKMQFYQEGESDKHLRDIAGILRVCGDALDHKYLADWVSRLGLTEVWEAVVRRAGERD